MGVVNVTPDSFHPGSRSPETLEAVARAVRMAEQGADWIDVGGESTRPGAAPVPIDAEVGRVLPTIAGIRDALSDVCISIDTRRAGVARQALDAGADLVNDVSSLSDPGMLDVIVEHGCPVCVMHMQGLPEDMQDDPRYEDVVAEVREALGSATGRLLDAGLEPGMIVVDPGIGFGKNLKHNLALLSAGRGVAPSRGMPLMWGASRKSMFRDLLGRESSVDRLPGTLGVAAMAPSKGVDIIRVHDVADHADLYAAMSALG
jgi:dihydropteroate synthase